MSVAAVCYVYVCVCVWMRELCTEMCLQEAVKGKYAMCKAERATLEARVAALEEARRCAEAATAAAERRASEAEAASDAVCARLMGMQSKVRACVRTRMSSLMHAVGRYNGPRATRTLCTWESEWARHATPNLS
jgi:hypothetical protein